jgi:hypothetical protein
MPEVDILIRDARSDEANFAAEMTRKMVIEMHGYGGRTAAASASAWEKVAGSPTTLPLRSNSRVPPSRKDVRRPSLHGISAAPEVVPAWDEGALTGPGSLSANPTCGPVHGGRSLLR